MAAQNMAQAVLFPKRLGHCTSTLDFPEESCLLRMASALRSKVSLP